jgi:hypothetical protein
MGFSGPGVYLVTLGLPWRRDQVVSSLAATKEIGAMGHEIESRQSTGW